MKLSVRGARHLKASSFKTLSSESSKRHCATDHMLINFTQDCCMTVVCVCVCVCVYVGMCWCVCARSRAPQLNICRASQSHLQLICHVVCPSFVCRPRLQSVSVRGRGVGLMISFLLRGSVVNGALWPARSEARGPFPVKLFSGAPRRLTASGSFWKGCWRGQSAPKERKRNEGGEWRRGEHKKRNGRRSPVEQGAGKSNQLPPHTH